MKVKSIFTFNSLLMFTLLSVLVACNPAGGDKKEQVEIKTDGIFTDPTVNFLNGQDLGEFLVGSDTVIVPVRITNKSKHGWFNMTFKLANNSDGFFYRKNAEDSDPGYPGFGGTCGSNLAAGENCMVYMQYEPTKAGDFNQVVTLKYTNIVSPEEIEYTMTALTGEAASVVFIDDVAVYNHGVIEQTEPPTIETNITIKNAGGLSAKNLSFQMIKEQPSDPDPAGFNITANDCPINLGPKETCNLTITYLALNNLETDPEIEYKSNFRVTYVNDPFGTLAFLNGYWSSLSTKIQGVFQTNLPNAEFLTDEGDNPIVGNILTKSVKVTNVGYREGILLEAIIKNPTYGTGPNDEWAICTKPAVPGDFMECKTPAGAPIGVSDQFPWKMKDTTGCLEEETAGIVGDNTVGDSCFFEVHFHPSTTLAYNATHSFNGSTIEFKYDSRWKGNTTIFQEEYFQLYGTAVGAGKLAVDSFLFNNTPLTVDTSGTLTSAEDSFALYDAGRVALVTSATYFTPFEFRVKNIGSSPVSVTSIVTKNTLTGQVDVNIGAFDTKINIFFTKVSSSCFASELAPGQVCAMQGRFAPVHQLSEPANDEQAYDETSGADKWKNFNFAYTDGTTIEDDALTSRPNRIAQGRFTQALVAKGYLAYDSSRPVADGKYGVTLVEGNKAQIQVKLINVGTAGIPYIKMKQYNPDNPNTNVPHPQNRDDFELIPGNNNLDNWPFTVIPTPASWLTANHGWTDCYPHIDRRHIIGSDTFVVDTYAHNASGGVTALSAHASYPTPDNGWEFPSLGKCALTIEMEMPYPNYKSEEIDSQFNAGGTGSETGFNDNYRHANYRVDKIGGNEIDLRYAETWRNMNQPQIISFEYFDGDFVGRGPASADPCDLDNYGDLHLIAPGDPTKDDTYEVAVDFKQYANVTPQDPTPHSSGIIYRPGWTYPATSGDTNDAWYEPAFNMPEWWDYTYFAVSGLNHAGVKASFAKTVAKSAHNASYEYTYHMGTFPINRGPYAGQFTLVNRTQQVVNDLVVDWTAPDGGHPIQATAGMPLNSVNISGGLSRTILFEFTPTVAGTYNRVIEYTYNDGLETVTKRIKVEAIAVDGDYADLEVYEEDYNVSYDPVGGAAEVLSGSKVLINSHINKITGSADTTMTTVRRGNIDADVTIYAKKRIYVKNPTTAQNISNITVTWRTSATTYQPDNFMANIGVATNTSASVECQGTADLTPGSECIIDITYTPYSPSATNYRVMTIHFEISPGQYLQKNVYFGFTPLDPANVTVPTLATEPTFDQNNVPRSSYPLNWGNITLQNYPVTIPTDKIITVENTSALNASFIKQWQCYQEEQNPANNGGSSCITDVDNDGTDEFIPANAVTTQDVGDTSSPVLIYSKFGVQVRANHECFYGDDNYAGDASDNTKGFNSSTSIACQLRFRYNADESYVMEQIGSAESMIRLSYWDYERNSFYSKLFFHPKGFILPNAVNAGTYNNVSSDDGGTIYFEWDPMTDNPFPANPAWGPITGYKVFGSTSPNSFSGTKIYDTQSLVDAAADTTDSFITVTSGVIDGLNIIQGTYYYFKVAARRNINGKDYYVDSGMPVLKVLSPPSGTVYDYTGNFLVDKNFNNVLKTWGASKTYCQGEQYSLMNTGSPVVRNKRLTNTSIHNWLKADASRSDYTYYAVPHWLEDNPTNISPIFNGCKAYDPANQTDVCQDYPVGETPEAWLTYFKSCTDTSCDSLYKVYGTINATNEVFYTDDPEMTFYQRCYAPL